MDDMVDYWLLQLLAVFCLAGVCFSVAKLAKFFKKIPLRCRMLSLFMGALYGAGVAVLFVFSLIHMNNTLYFGIMRFLPLCLRFYLFTLILQLMVFLVFWMGKQFLPRYYWNNTATLHTGFILVWLLVAQPFVYMWGRDLWLFLSAG